ncbi:aldehyde dehydrogenase family protein [Paenibacillus tundrae]
MTIQADQETVIVEAFINGQHVKSLSQLAKENPTNPTEIVGYFPVTTKEQAVEAIEAAAEAFKTWKQTSMDERIIRMRRAIEKIRAAENEIVHLLSREHGKPLYDAHGEIYVALMWMEFGPMSRK